MLYLLYLAELLGGNIMISQNANVPIEQINQNAILTHDNVTELANSEIAKTIDRVIKEIWMNEIASDYCDGALLKEDTLKNSFYHHLRVKLDDFLKKNRLRIYTEFNEKDIKKRKMRADLAIIKISNEESDSNYLGKCVGSVLTIIEFKYMQGGGNAVKIIQKDIHKMKDYIKHFKFEDCQYYLGIIHEHEYPNDEINWLSDRQSNSWAKGRLTELGACYYKRESENDENEIGFSVCSYNDFNEELNNAEFNKIKFKLLDLTLL